MLKIDDTLDMINMSDRFSLPDKGLISQAISVYRTSGDMIDFGGNTRIEEVFLVFFKPTLDEEYKKRACLSKKRAAAGRNGGKAKKKNATNASNVANVSNEANANFATQAIKESKTLQEGDVTAGLHFQENSIITSKNLVNGGDNNIYNNTTTNNIGPKCTGGDSINNNTTITNNNAQNKGLKPESKSVGSADSELKLGNKPELKGSVSTNNKAPKIESPVSGCSLGVYPGDKEKSLALLKKAGVWDTKALELASGYPYQRIMDNYKLKKADFDAGTVQKLGAVLVKAIMEDHAAAAKAAQLQAKSAGHEMPAEVLDMVKQMNASMDR